MAMAVSGITVRVGGTEYAFGSLDAGWLRHEIRRREEAGERVCVVVSARTDELDLALPTAGCPPGAGGRPPTPREAAVIEEWRKHRLGEDGWNFGNLWAFLERLERMA